MHYFTGTADQALATWLREKDYIVLHGRRPLELAGDDDRLTLHEAADRFLVAKQQQADLSRS